MDKSDEYLILSDFKKIITSSCIETSRDFYWTKDSFFLSSDSLSSKTYFEEDFSNSRNLGLCNIRDQIFFDKDNLDFDEIKVRIDEYFRFLKFFIKSIASLKVNLLNIDLPLLSGFTSEILKINGEDHFSLNFRLTIGRRLIDLSGIGLKTAGVEAEIILLIQPSFCFILSE